MVRARCWGFNAAVNGLPRMSRHVGAPAGARAMSETAFPRRGSRPDLAVLVGLAGLAFLIRLAPLLLGGGLFGILTYDDGVYFGAAVALVDGRIPYRDFLLLHPPGILYMLAPFGALAGLIGDAASLATARIAFMALGALNATLVALIAGRFGRRAAILSGGLYAIWMAPAFVERTTYLIGPQNTLLLLALLVLARSSRTPVGMAPGVRRSAVAGALLGASAATQIWGAATFVVVLAWLVVTARRQPGGWLRPVAAYVAATAVTMGIMWLPFLLATGPDMVRYIVFDQLGRTPN